MATDTYARQFRTWFDDGIIHSGRIVHPRCSIPFTEAQESLLILPILHVTETFGIPLTYELFKTEAVDFAKEMNAPWDVDQNYTEWYEECLKRHPQLATAIYKPSVDQYRQRLRQIVTSNDHVPPTFDSQLDVGIAPKKPRLTECYDNIPDTEISDYIISLENQGTNREHLIWRKLDPSEKLNDMVELYGNFVFNAFGYIVGVVIGRARYQTIEDTFLQDYLATLEHYNKFEHDNVKDLNKVTGCSFVQEIRDGLRIHPQYIFSLNVFADSDSAGVHGKTACRRQYQALCTLAKEQSEMLASPAFLTFLCRKLQVVNKTIAIPYNADPMPNIDYDLRHVFQESNDATDGIY